MQQVKYYFNGLCLLDFWLWVWYEKGRKKYITGIETLLGVDGDGLGGCGGEAETGIANFAEGTGVFCACDESDPGTVFFVWGSGEADFC